jgi:hypothetical protein
MLSSASLGSAPIQSFSLEDEINKGWTGNVSFANKPSILQPDLHTEILSFSDRFQKERTSPPMLLRTRSKRFSMSQGWSGSYALMDLVSWKLSQGTLSFPTFSNTSSATVINAVASACGVTVTNAPDFPLWKEDFKQVDGWSVLRRMAILAGMQIKIESDKVKFITQEETSPLPWGFVAEDQEASNTPMDRYEKIFVSKNLGLGTIQPEQYYDYTEPGYLTNQPLITPLSQAIPYDMSTAGSIGWVGFWDAENRLISIHPLGGGTADGYTEPINGEWPAVKFSVWVYPSPTAPYATNVRMRILGIPEVAIPSGIDPAISAYLGTGRGYPQPFSDTMIPSLAYANSKYLDWLREINRHTFTIEANGPLQCDAVLLLPHLFDRHSGRVEKTRWQGSSKGGASNVMVEVMDPGTT